MSHCMSSFRTLTACRRHKQCSNGISCTNHHSREDSLKRSGQRGQSICRVACLGVWHTARQKFQQVSSFHDDVWVPCLPCGAYSHGAFHLTKIISVEDQDAQFLTLLTYYARSRITREFCSLLTKFSSQPMPTSFSALVAAGHISLRYRSVQ